MKPWEWAWFQKLIAFLRKWAWFEKWGYGYSKDLEDFVHNPFEELRDNSFPFCFRDVDPKSLLIRFRFIPYLKHREEWYAKYSSVPGTYRLHYDFPAWVKTFGNELTLGSDIGYGKWKSKYPNATVAFQLILSWWHLIPIPFFSLSIRLNELSYLQFGAGWGPQWANYNGRHPEEDGKVNAVLCGKFRYVDYAAELKRNPDSEVYGYFEGDV